MIASMYGMLMWIAHFAVVAAHIGVKPRHAVALQAARVANHKVISAYQSILPSPVAESLIRQQQILEFSFQDVPDVQDVLWQPAEALKECLNSYVDKLNIDLIPAWRHGGLQDELSEDMTRAASTCASPWNEAKRLVVSQVAQWEPSPSPFLSWCWLPIASLLGCVILYLKSRGVQSGIHMQCHDVQTQPEGEGQSITSLHNVHQDQTATGRLATPASTTDADEVAGARQRLRTGRSRTPPGSAKRTQTSSSTLTDDQGRKVKPRGSPKTHRQKSDLQPDARSLVRSSTTPCGLESSAVLPASEEESVDHSCL